MPTKEELETEVAALRLQVNGRPAKKGCAQHCKHGLLYHGGLICYGEGRINTFYPCVCPEHPDDPPIPAKWVD